MKTKYVTNQRHTRKVDLRSASRAIISALIFVAATLASSNLAAQGPGTGTIVGRVLNATNGKYLGNARITVKDSRIEELTDANGEYRLANVPEGAVSISVLYTGLEQLTEVVQVRAGQVTERDFSLTRLEFGKGGQPVTLDEFVVAASREINAQAIAINEQKLAPNVKTVISADEFGDIGESNLGEFIKLMPGVTVNYSVGIFANDIQVRGFPSTATAVTLDGAQAAHAGNGSNSRGFALNSLQTLNSVDRVEVSKTPTPDTPASSLGGSVNVVSKSSFERSRPVFSYRTSASWNSRMPIGRRANLNREGTSNAIRPAFDFGYVYPVSKTFGFTLSGSYNSRFYMVDLSESTWDLVNLRLTNHSLDSSAQLRDAIGAGITMDWKLAENHQVSASFSYSDYYVFAPRVANTEAVGTNPIGGPNFTQSSTATGSATIANTAANQTDESMHGSLKYRHTGKFVKVDGNLFYSFASHKRRVTDKGLFAATNAVLPNVAIRFDEIGGRHPGPGVVTARTAAGALVDVTDVNNFQLRTATDGRISSYSVVNGGQINARRDFDTRIPVALKTGLYLNRELRDVRSSPLSWTFVGPDRIANNADNIVGLYDFVANAASAEDPPYGFQKSKYISGFKVHDYFRAHPEQFTLNETAAISGRASGSTRITETISAAYIRADMKLLNNRLWLVGGVRLERTEDEGHGVLNDLRNTYQQDPNGNLILNAAGQPIRKTTDPIELARLQFTERGAYAKRSYSDYYPSVNASFNVTENIVARVAYARTIGRPQFANIVPGITATAPDVSNPTITVNNTALKPWTADAFDISLETYLGNNGVASIGAFRKDITDFFGAVETPASPDSLADFGLGDDYLGYTIRTSNNVGSARITGLEMNYRQALVFLPVWAQGVQVFANGTFLDLDGNRTADFNNFATRTLNYGISLSRPRFSVKLNWNSNGDIRGNLIAQSATIPADTYFYTTRRTTLDGSFEVRVHRKWSIYGTARNLTDRRVRRERYGPGTPSYAFNNRYLEVGAFITVGVKGEF